MITTHGWASLPVLCAACYSHNCPCRCPQQANQPATFTFVLLRQNPIRLHNVLTHLDQTHYNFPSVINTHIVSHLPTHNSLSTEMYFFKIFQILLHFNIILTKTQPKIFHFFPLTLPVHPHTFHYTSL